MRGGFSRSPRGAAPGSDTPSATPVKRFTLADVSDKTLSLPGRYVYYALQGFGKTSFLTNAPSPIFMMTRGETGLLTLMENGQVKPTSYLPEMLTWEDLLAGIEFLRTEQHEFKTLVIDTLNGAERLCHEYVCRRDFENDWTDKGFMGYMRGYEVSLADWRMFQNELDKLRRERGMTIWTLAHSRIKTFKNPTGADYDRYAPEMHEKTWGVSRGWFDNILFGQTEVTVRQGSRIVDKNRKGKVEGAGVRVMCTNSDDPTYEAKNRSGLPAVIGLGDSHQEDWALFVQAVKEAKEGSKAHGE